MDGCLFSCSYILQAIQSSSELDWSQPGKTGLSGGLKSALHVSHPEDQADDIATMWNMQFSWQLQERKG